MAAWSCHGNRDAKLEMVSIAKVSERRQVRAGGSAWWGLRAPQWVPTYTGCPWLLLLGWWDGSGHPTALGCISGATPRTSISRGTAPLLPPSLSSSAVLAAVSRGRCCSLQQSSEGLALQPRGSGHMPGGRMPLRSTIRATLTDNEENAFGAQSISNVIFHNIA